MSVELMQQMAVWFWSLAAGVGILVLLAGVLAAGGWAVVKALEYLRAWHTLCLILGIQMHGKRHRDDLFWKAIKEHAGHSDFAADNIIQFVQKVRPNNGSGV